MYSIDGFKLLSIHRDYLYMYKTPAILDFDTKTQKDILERETQICMEKINDLLDPDCQWDSNPEGDGFKGNDRFI